VSKSPLLAFLSIALCALALAFGCARGTKVELADAPLHDALAEPEESPRERYVIAYTLWNVDLRELLLRIPGERHRVEPAFDRLRADLALMRDLLEGEQRRTASSLLDELDQLKPTIVRARSNIVVDRRLDPIAKQVKQKLSPDKATVAEGSG